MVPLRFEYHLRRRLAASRTPARFIRAIINGVNNRRCEFPSNRVLHKAKLLLTKVAAANSALIGNDDEFVSVLFQTHKRFGNSAEDFDLFGVGTVSDIPHDRAVEVKEYGRREPIRRWPGHPSKL